MARNALADIDLVAFGNDVEELDHVFVPQLDAAPAGRGADSVLVVGAVDVDVAGV